MNNTTPTTKVIKDVLLRKMSVQLHEVLRKFAKDNGATENFDVKVHPDEKVEFSWEIDKNTFLAEDKDSPAPEPCYDSTYRVYRVATGDIQVGDLVMVRDDKGECWQGPMLLEKIVPPSHSHYVFVTVGRAIEGWRFARHLTDEERAQLKRI